MGLIVTGLMRGTCFVVASALDSVHAGLWRRLRNGVHGVWGGRGRLLGTYAEAAISVRRRCEIKQERFDGGTARTGVLRTDLINADLAAGDGRH